MTRCNDAIWAVINGIDRLHRRLFDDDEWGAGDYAHTYGPLALFIAFEVLVLWIAGIVN